MLKVTSITIIMYELIAKGENGPFDNNVLLGIFENIA